MSISLCKLNQVSQDEFIDKLSGIFEHSPWVAAGAADERPFASVDELHAAMVAAVDRADETLRLGLIRAHPDLAGKVAIAGKLTPESTSEQKGAGLDSLTKDEYARFHGLNHAYTARFGFPFILAVRGHDKHSIMAAFERRLENDADAEMREALAQIARIGHFRLNDLVEE
ncbi:2-oxo-4-hydroxy-4-carboxy-5-ureidoimidazoline decarboxylase [Oricola cellulosilytica]|uniref:2-oxo-4-hydroxy-4-carboxy-5-ureidoimidazoline decarboxylase n=1 Tax=Oricola cellulosilytica TaxID=1429082 RepID=A0A4R0P725_9HYPH|nr:2-oxo-4-hydroxy-4-carboxy-5-ureidoimidazoline decarboxylase [Oricola cellulosilytica]TCD11298.1 2-oxo-4-hydroxy-4-carboxy-5-ureidoimidazoline decarboxylase [Oricola cellulosilytica]